MSLFLIDFIVSFSLGNSSVSPPLCFLALDGSKIFVSVNTVNVPELLENAKRIFHSDDGMLFQLIGEGDLVACASGVVEHKAKLWFRPLFHSLSLTYRTLSQTKSLRLLAKRVAKTNEFKGRDGIDGYSYRLDGVTVGLVVRSPHENTLTRFLEKFRQQTGVVINEETLHRSVDYGVLRQHFEVNKTDIKREDGIESFDNDGEDRSSHHYSMYV